MKITFSAPDLPDQGVVVVGVLEDRKLTASAKRLDERMGGRIKRAMAASRFQGKKDQTLVLVAPGGSELDRLGLVGLGKPAEIDALRMQAIGGIVHAALGSQGPTAATVLVDAVKGCSLDPATMAAELALGARLRSYRFGRYLTKEKEEDKPSLAALTVCCDGADTARALYEPHRKVADGVFLTRDLVSEPANVIYPESLAAEAKKLEELGVTVEVLGEKEMRKLGMNALLAVGQGSDRESQLVVMRWQGGKAKKKEAADDSGPLLFVGKGVTFDTGGISIKPSANMEDMKWDMAGAAAVIGLMKALAGREARVDAVGIAGLVENMPSGKAQRPGDVVTSMSGQTIEVINTDAEGRLVLADALWYGKKRFKPRLMIDLATLTGAIIISLGEEQAGLFSTDDELAGRIAAAGAAVGEPVWRMPLGEAYDKAIKSDIADMKNVGERGAGSITAAQFLKRFVGDTPWAHLDIAGVAWTKKDRDTCPKGGSGFGVRLLDRLVADHYEDR
ncbi:MAG: leucyl aminopeptidase [Rhodospirillales bacterium]